MKISLFVLTFLMFNIQLVFSQTRQVTGKVTDITNTALPGVSITVKGTSQGTATDVSGNYTLSLNSANAVLVYSYIGYISKEMPVANQSQINITLLEDVANLSEVVVVGYGTQKKSQMTGAISSLSGKEIAELPLTNARQALQGRAAGVDVTQPGSKPGSAAQIRIRGRRSFNASNDPLFVVDGIPLSGGIDDINPNDISSMEVLKDASSTAIYGSRGSNGVVIVSTKRGKPGKTLVSWDSYFGTNSELGKIGVMNGAQYAEYKRESRRSVGQYPLGAATEADDAKIFEPREIENIKAGRSTDYVDQMLRNGALQSHNLSVSGGDSKTNFYVSGNIFEDIGIIKKQDFTRYSFRVNIDHQISKKIKVGLSSIFVGSDRNGEFYNPMGGAFQENPLGKPFNDDGTLSFLPTNDGLRTNPLAEIVDGAQVDETKRYRAFNSIYGEWNILNGLKYRINFGPDYTFSRNGRFTGALTNANRGGNATGSSTDFLNFNYTVENVLSYAKTFNSVHNFNVTALQSFQKDRIVGTSISVSGIPAETQQYYRLGDASQITGANTNLIEWTILSYMGRINYDYKEKYLLTATLRADGSSRFGADSKFGYFPSIAVGWNISNENFLKEVKFIDQLKLRLSYGAVGNTGLNPYQTQALLGRTAYAWDNTPAYGFRPNTIGNPSLKWETSTTANGGLDFSLFSGKLSGSLELYETITSALLAPQPLPPSVGFGGFTTNVGKTRNRGIELTLGTTNIDRGGFQWTSDFVFTKNKEAILELANGKVDDIAAGRFIGQPLSVFFDYKKIGIWQKDQADEAAKYGDKVGQIRIEDIAGRDASGVLTKGPDGKINADDRQILGSAVPNFVVGLTNRFTYKGFDLSFFVYGRFGQFIRSRFHNDFNALAGRYNNLNINYWTPNNPTNEFPQPVVTQEFPKYNSSLVFFDGSFIKIRNISMGYNVPSKIASKMKMEGLRIYSSIQQPFIFAEYRSKYKGIDPETYIDGEPGVLAGEVNANVAPATRIITIGINAKF